MSIGGFVFSHGNFLKINKGEKTVLPKFALSTFFLINLPVLSFLWYLYGTVKENSAGLGKEQ